MAIEPVKKITILTRRGHEKRLMRTLGRLGAVEVRDPEEDLATTPGLEPCGTSTEEADDRLSTIDFILNLMKAFAPDETGLIQGLAPVPLVTTQEEINRILETYDLDAVYRQARKLDEDYRSTERIIAEISAEIAELKPLAGLDIVPADVLDLERTVVTIGHVPAQNMPLFEGMADLIAWEELEPGGDGPFPPGQKGQGRQKVLVVTACLARDRDEVAKRLKDAGFEEAFLPRLYQRIPDRLVELEDSLAVYRERLEEIAAGIRELAHGRRSGEGRRPLVILKAYWIHARERALASRKGLKGRWVHVISGYIRQKDLDRLHSVMVHEFPDSLILEDDPGPGEDVPVSISVPRPLSPLTLLVEMFGLPPYRSFDPTPFLHLNFYVFFGICFSDVLYGLMLVVSSAYVSMKTKDYRGVNNFARMLLYGGVSSIVFGALMGSWFGDLYRPEYLGEGNILVTLREGFFVIDPMSRTILALLVVLGIGVLNQFYGISLRMYGQIRNRDLFGAFSDGICWMGALTGLLIVVSGVFTDVPDRIAQAGKWLLGVGAILLVLTQGRDARNPVVRILKGVMSLYGIVGSYGVTAFAGDVLSHCRLLALGLTTSIVAMAFNLMAGMLRDIPFVGLILFVLVLVVGHAFNFAISVLGAFVHSMRLVYVEFFGRFYEAGARPFRPLEFDSPLCILKKSRSEA